ncbi:MAG: hypothetical protein U9P07_07825 [Pseudomonadota bacterium]|nr:hypothetical protein [Pseudomonadota bacterium]
MLNNNSQLSKLLFKNSERNLQGMFRHGSRSFSPAVHGLPVRAARRQAGFRGVRRESRRVIRSAANTACLSADRL